MPNVSGQCLCGFISYQCTEAPVMTVHCQCRDCQRISGAGHATNFAIPKGSLKINGELVFHEKPADSGNMVKRGFCPKCGSHIYVETSGMPGFEFLRAGSLDDPELVEPSMVAYAGSGASWDHIDSSLPTFQKMPEM